jgi:CP family cyanate transporter-like MFS transporter
MGTKTVMNKTQRFGLMLLVLVLIGLNMRPLLTSVGPLLPQLRAASGMSFTIAALLTALPVVAMGVLALAGSWINTHFSERNSVALSLLMVAAGAAMRELAPQSVLLLSSALLGGIGIGIIQVVMPTVIKRLFQRRMPQVMGLWSAALMGGGGLGAALTPWIATHSEVWHRSLAWWALPAIIALIGWWPQSKSLAQGEQKASSTRVRITIHPRAWTLGLYFGVINGGYASLIAWLPPYYIQLGVSAQFSGTLLALMTVGQTAGALLLPMLARHQDRRKLLLFALCLQMIGFCGFIAAPLQMSIFWAVTCGVGLGGAFPLCLVLALDHSPHPVIAGRLVAFMQGIGFIIAGLSPYLSGVLRSISGNYLMDWTFHAFCVAGLMLLTLRFIPARYPQEWIEKI